MHKQKYIALVDCDSFFVSCERVLNPELEGKPVCVVSGERGCIISRSKEAKAMGVPMGQPLFMAKEQFSKCIYINAKHYEYGELSSKVMSVLKDFSPFVEIYSIDEAFVDFTGLAKFYGMNYFELAKFLRQEIYDKTQIPVSIGVSMTKTLAKLASDKAKNLKSHICIVGKQGIPNFLKSSNIEEIWGIGRKLSPKLKGYGIKTAYDYTQKNDIWLKSRFGKNGLEIKYELLGNIVSNVTNEVVLPKSIMDTRSFSEFTSELNFLKNELMVHIHNACRKLRRADCKCSTIGVILKTKDFKTCYSKVKLDIPVNFEFEISKSAFVELEKMYNENVLYRSIGILFEDFISCEKEQMYLFGADEKHEKKEKLGRSLDKLETKFGRNIVTTGFTNKEIPIKQSFLTKPNNINTNSQYR